MVREVMCGGPKDYAFKVHTPSGNDEVVCKAFRLDYATSEKINFEVIKNSLLNPDQRHLVKILNRSILRTKTHDIVTTPTIKSYKICHQKRVYDSDQNSKPYGYTQLNV